MDEPAPKSLQRFLMLPLTIIVAAAIFAWLGSSAYWIWKRHEFLNRPGFGGYPHGMIGYSPFPTPSPWPLRILGEQGIAEIFIPDEEYEPDAKALFPEVKRISLPIREQW